ncbi:hypothetical protein [Paracnuella aquatica]|uniref:hypothetical protein n=1 Tax=Paracnuella aquatica TaxID=2268757 RepID=UPI000DF012BF|nr:hypothetical protein [Paracnuella aquatica]
MKFGVIIFVFSLFSCVSKEANKKELQKDVSKTTERPKFHPTYTDELEDTVRTIDLSYVAWACQCANWVKASEHEQYQESGGLAERSMFVEPADSTLTLADTIGYTGDVIRFTGQFYKDKGYPKNYPITEMDPDKAKVFRYTKYKILSSGYVNFREN